MSIDRVKRFTAEMVKAGVFAPNDIDVGALATDRFVNKGVGLDVRAKLVK
jgi:NitT/TauT family transport system substrate-binding protein